MRTNIIGPIDVIEEVKWQLLTRWTRAASFYSQTLYPTISRLYKSIKKHILFVQVLIEASTVLQSLINREMAVFKLL